MGYEPENYSPQQFNELDRLTERWLPIISGRPRPQKSERELVTLEYLDLALKHMTAAHACAHAHWVLLPALRACLGLHAVGRSWGTASDIDLRIIDRPMP